MRFLDERTVVTNDYAAIDPGYGQRVTAVLARHGLDVVTFPYSVSTTVTEGIPSAVGNWVNFLRVGNLIVVPEFGYPADRTAVSILRDRLPNCSVVPLDATDLARRGGVLELMRGRDLSHGLSSVGRVTSTTDPPVGPHSRRPILC